MADRYLKPLIITMTIGIIALFFVYLWNTIEMEEVVSNGIVYNVQVFSTKPNSSGYLDPYAESPANFSHFRSAVNVFYNRMPKCGSSSTWEVLKKNAKGRYKTHFFSIYDRRNTSTRGDIFTFARWYSRCKRRCLFNAHKFFIDFSVLPFDLFPPPVYINLVRDPLHRVMSGYYYRRFKKHDRKPMTNERRRMTFDECVTRASPECVNSSYNHLSVVFFCGTDAACAQDDQTALQRAKRNIVQHYAVVGYLENLAEFYEALELALPDWFEGISSRYKQMLEDDNDKANVTPDSGNNTLSENNISIMKSVLWSEYELYWFIRQRFHFILKTLKTNDTEVY